MIFFYFFFFIAVNLIIYLNHSKLKVLGIPFDNPDKVRKFQQKPILISGGFILIINIQMLLIFLIKFQDTFLNKIFTYQIDLIFFNNNFIIFYIRIYDDEKKY